MTVLDCEGLCKWYGDVMAVNDISITLDQGITGILGPNGAGKSTFLKMAVGLSKPSKGWIDVLEEDPWDNTALRSRIGFVPEGPAPWRDRTGLEAATLAGRYSGFDEEEAEAEARRVLDVVGLEEETGKEVDAYSRGMRQRFKFALALMGDPELLILDEPLQGCDPLSRRDLIRLTRDLADEGRSLLVSTHILPDIQVMTEQIMLFNKGRLLAHGKVAEIRDLLEQYPRTVRISTSDPDRISDEIWGWESVVSMEKEEGAILARTDDPTAFYADLQDLFIEEDIGFTSVTSVDDDVESLFHYLVGEG